MKWWISLKVHDKRNKSKSYSQKEKGSISIFCALAFVVILGFTMVAVTHQQFTFGLGRVREASTNISRAAAQQIDWEESSRVGRPVVDPVQARVAAQSHLKNFPDVEIEKITVVDSKITVTVSKQVDGLVKNKKVFWESTSDASNFWRK